ncbi:hydantoinase/oxoprolinase family protein [Stetteria hydrogenophila]
MARLRVGVDVGGTFTDLVAFDEESGRLLHLKTLSTPREPWRGFLAAVDGVGAGYDSIEVIVHATTLGTNMLLGQEGLEPPRALLITNEGFRDVVEIGRQNRPELYNLFFERPRPLVPRSRRVGIKGRIGPRGEELEPIDEGEVARVAREHCGEVEVFVVSLLHSYRNPAHEARVKEVVARECPGAIVVASHEVDPQPGEYERTSTTLVNALLKPVLSRYLSRLKAELRARGYTGELLVMRSNGGVASVEAAVEKPAAFIESGPAAGAVAVAYMSRLMGVGKALGFDMGGTTAKASAVVNGEPLVVSEYEVGGRVHMGRTLRGSGYPVRFPHIDLAEVSAGGGTIAWVDEGGALRVGPVSAGADPGPACYGRGGSRPTVTDANLVLGRLPRSLAGGAVVLREDLAREALKRLGDELGMDPVEAAAGVVRIANAVMARALRLVSVERGHDPREFSLFAFGGAGPLHAVDLARELGVREVVVPPLPGVFSALGLLLADYRHDYYASIVEKASRLADGVVEEKFRRLEERAVETLKSEGVAGEDIRLARMLGMRYWGQAYELEVPYRGSLREAVEDFHKLHEARYGYSMPGEEVEVVTARLEAIGLVAKPRLPRGEEVEHKPQPRGWREVYFDGEGWVRAGVYPREGLKPGAVIEGPAVVESDESTVLVPPGYTAKVDALHSIRIRVS